MLIEYIKTFCDVVDLKSFSRAAEANFVTQSAASQQIGALEKTWKVQLMERHRWGLSLTKTGELVYRESKKILEHYNTIQRLVRKDPRDVGGNLRIATIYSIGLYELQPHISRFIKRYPQVNVNVDYRPNKAIYDDVFSYRADFGIVSYPAARPGIRVLPFQSDHLVIVCHPRHPLAKRRRVQLSKIQGEKFIGFEEEVPTRKAIDHALREKGVSVKIVMQLNNIETLKRAVEINAGISIVPLQTISQEIEHRALKAVEISGPPLTRPNGILVREGRNLPLTAVEFINMLTDARR